MNRILNILLITLALGVGGCNFGKDNTGSPQPRSPSVRAARNERITQLEDELDIRDKQIEELRTRAGRLAREIKRLKFLNEQMEKQLEAVGDAPRRRDEFKQQVAEKQLEIDRLKSQIRKLEQAIRLATSKPTTRPD
ncbi:MAG: hypothetical protein KAV00_13675 [Phycisphaerae bacterium]|nr:hypothetical protein [Phycisphaerae bacterium]